MLREIGSHDDKEQFHNHADEITKTIKTYIFMKAI